MTTWFIAFISMFHLRLDYSRKDFANRLYVSTHFLRRTTYIYLDCLGKHDTHFEYRQRYIFQQNVVSVYWCNQWRHLLMERAYVYVRKLAPSIFIRLIVRLLWNTNVFQGNTSSEAVEALISSELNIFFVTWCIGTSKFPLICRRKPGHCDTITPKKNTIITIIRIYL